MSRQLRCPSRLGSESSPPNILNAKSNRKFPDKARGCFPCRDQRVEARAAQGAAPVSLGGQGPREDQAPGLSVDVTPFKRPAPCQLWMASATYLEPWGRQCIKGVFRMPSPSGMDDVEFAHGFLFLPRISGESLMASSAPLCS